MVKNYTCKKNCRKAPEGYEDLVFVTKNNRPTQQFIVQEGIESCVRNLQKQYPEFEKCHATDDTLFEAMRLMEKAM